MRKDLRPTDGLELDDLDELEVVARLRLSIARLARRLRQEAGTGLSPSQHSALISVASHGPLTLGHLARVEQVSPPTITRIAVKLEDDGLVARTVDPTDRRISRVQVTAEGERRLEHGRNRRNAWLAERLRTFDPEQRRQIEAALDVLEALAVSPETPDHTPDPPTDHTTDHTTKRTTHPMTTPTTIR
jgi:DNA-binding MarR family transcriptional regulator